jgi:integrase
MAKPYKRKGSKYWYVAPWIDGRQVPQSSGTTDYEQAEKKLKILEGRIASGAPIHARTDRGAFAELLELVRSDYQVKEQNSLYDAEKRLDVHLIPRLGHLPTGKISTQAINDYILARRSDQERKASNGTINRELALIKRAFTLGIREGLVSSRPHIELLPENNTRKGFFGEESFRAVLAHANATLKDVLVMAYYTGWRIESILKIQWRNVDLAEGNLRLFAEQTKNTMQTFFPLDPFPQLRTMLERRAQERKENRIIIPQVFHRDGKPVKSIRTAWEVARVAAGVPGRLIHDFRRTAVRNLKKMGFSDTEIMEMVGIKTISIFRRYNITTEADITEKAKAIAKRALQN